MADFLRSFLFDHQTLKTRRKTTTHQAANERRAMGDYDAANAYDETTEKQLHRQQNNTKTLVITIDNEIAESKEDLHSLGEQINSAEEIFPKRWQLYQGLKKTCQDQCNEMQKEIARYAKNDQKYACQLHSVEERLESLQYVIDEMKRVQEELQ